MPSLLFKLRLLLRVWKVYFAKRKNGLAVPGGGGCTPQLTRISHLAPQCQNLRLAIYIFHPLYGEYCLAQKLKFIWLEIISRMTTYRIEG